MMLDFALNDPSTIDESASKQAEPCTDAANPGDWLTAVAQRDAIRRAVSMLTPKSKKLAR
jgi:hypothetical protein